MHIVFSVPMKTNPRDELIIISFMRQLFTFVFAVGYVFDSSLSVKAEFLDIKIEELFLVMVRLSEVIMNVLTTIHRSNLLNTD